MPTKKRRVGFIPRKGVLDIIDKLSNENNVSYSRIINILVEEALSNRRLFNIKNGEILEDNKNAEVIYKISEIKSNLNKEFSNDLNNKMVREKNLNLKEVNYESLDDEIYDKFIMFLQFKEKMEQRDL